MKTSSKKHVMLVIATLGAGGAERTVTLLANEFAARGSMVTLVTLDSGAVSHHHLDPLVNRHPLNVMRHCPWPIQKNINQVRIIGALKRAFSSIRPDAIISFIDKTNVLCLLAARGLTIPVIVSEQVDPRSYDIGSGWRYFRNRTYPRAAAVVIQVEQSRSWAVTVTKLSRVHVIQNPVAPPAHELEPLPGLPEQYIAAVGRLTAQKGFDLLIQSFGNVLQQYPQVHLVIAGEGNDRAALENQAAQLKIADRVHLIGIINEPYRLLAHCRLFVLSSRFEGLPNVLLEAMAAGRPVVSFDCPTGPGELINHGKNGLLIPPGDVNALSDAILHLLRAPEHAAALGHQARADTHRFGVENITDQWENLIEQVSTTST